LSIVVKLQNNSSPLNKVDKSISDVITLTGNLRNETDVVNPEILIEYTGDFPVVNYCTIDIFHRSYFIEDIRTIRTHIWLVKAHSDPLSSFKSQIRNNKALLLRQENMYDLLLNDGVFRCRQNSRIGTIAFPNGFGDFHYILLAAGGNNS